MVKKGLQAEGTACLKLEREQVGRVEGIEDGVGVGIRMEKARQGGRYEVWEVRVVPGGLVQGDEGGPICVVI